MDTLFKSGVAGKLRRNQVGVKVLGKVDYSNNLSHLKGSDLLTHKVNLEVTQVSDGALVAITKLGGSVNLVHYNRVGMRSLLKPEKFKDMPYLAPPPANINRKLKKPMKQPKQHPEFEQAQAVLRQRLAFVSE
jgi:large subunit ribosomal protein L15